MKPLIVKFQRIWGNIQRIGWVHFVLEVFRRFGKDNGGLLAAGLAFFLVLAFVPLILVGIAALGFFIHRPEDAVNKIQDLLTTQILPGSAGQEVKYIIQKANVAQTVKTVMQTKGIAGLVGIGSLLLAALQIFINGAVAMNAAWETKETRNWLKLRLVALGLLLATGVLMVLSISSTAYGTILSHKIPEGALLYVVGTEIGAVAIGTVMYGLIFKFLPSSHVSWRAAFVGGLVAAVAWEVAKKGLSVYLLRPNKSLYGEIADLFVFVLWVYYSMMILLLGAETSAVYASDIEGRAVARLKRAAQMTPSADGATGAGSALARSKERSRVQRVRKTGRQDGEQARRR